MPHLQDYKLYQIVNSAAHEVAAANTAGKRVIIIGGIQDLCRLPIQRGTWTAINRALAQDLPQDIALYAVGKADKPLWMEDDWTTESFIGGKKNPPAEKLAEQLFNLPPKGSPIADKRAFLEQLDKAAGNTAFVTFSTGSLLLQHVRSYLVERLQSNGLTDAELSPIMAKVGALNIAPIYSVGSAPEKFDFTQIAIINRKDPYAGGTPGVAAHSKEIYGCAAMLQQKWNGQGEKLQFTFLAYEAQLAKQMYEAHTLNPNLLKASNDIVGHVKINERNLVIYGDSVPDKYPSRVIHHFKKGKHIQDPAPPATPLQKEHDSALYLHRAAATNPERTDKYKVVQTFQRFAGAHLIPKALNALLSHTQTLDQLASEITEDERKFVAGLLAEQQHLDPDMLTQIRDN